VLQLAVAEDEAAVAEAGEPLVVSDAEQSLSLRLDKVSLRRTTIHESYIILRKIN